jgi:hypothetical protein
VPSCAGGGRTISDRDWDRSWANQNT